jgi:hypothetical protein
MSPAMAQDPKQMDEQLAWRCSRCGTEGTITQGGEPEEIVRRMLVHHERLAPRCEPRFIVVHDGKTMVIET